MSVTQTPATYTAEKVAVMIWRMRTAIERVELGEGPSQSGEVFVATEQGCPGHRDRWADTVIYGDLR